jgi:hypothetical protein
MSDTGTSKSARGSSTQVDDRPKVHNELSRYTTTPEQYGTSIYHPGVVTVALHWNIGRPNDAVVVTQWNTAAIGLTIAQLTAVQSAMDNAIVTNWKPLLQAGNQYKGSVVTDMSSNTGAQVTNSSFVPVNGTGASPTMTDSVALLISLHTPTRYRGGHGRMYFPGISGTFATNDGRSVTAAGVSAATGYWQAVQNAMTAIAGASGGPYVQCVWHKKLKTAPNTIEQVTSFTVQGVWASQRRRLRRVARH